MTEKETFNYCTESFKNFVISFYDKFKENTDNKFQFEVVFSLAVRAHCEEKPEIDEFSNYLSKCIAHYGDKLIAELRKVFEDVISSERRMEWN